MFFTQKEDRMNKYMNDIIDVLKVDYDIDASNFDDSFLTRIIDMRIRDTKSESYNEYKHIIKENIHETIVLKKLLNITYTRFFRDSLKFAQLQKIVIPNLVTMINKQRELRIWSAASSSGEEAYSLAILISEFEEELGIEIPYRIIATDISEAKLEKGRRGVFRKNEIIDLKLKYIEKYFTNRGSEYVISEKLKRNISFSYFDLIDDRNIKPPESIYGDFDLVLCNNLLFYYNPEVQRKIIAKSELSLAPNGYFITSETEKILVKDFTKLKQINPNSSIFKLKNQGGKV